MNRSDSFACASRPVTSCLLPPPDITHGTTLLLSLLASITTYYHPSNTGGWAGDMGSFLSALTHALCQRLGREAALAREDAKGANALEEEPAMSSSRWLGRPDREAIIRAVLPLAMSALYSKQHHMSRTAMKVCA